MYVGELIRSIQKPISVYVNEIVQAFHEKLHKDLLSVGKCSTPEDCNKKTKPRDLCKSCNSWFKELAAFHKKSNNPSWHKNCKSAKWSEDHWEVAKFFMPALGSKLSTVKDAESTDISSLLHVLEWLTDGAFLRKTRVNVDLARKLRSEVRNTWAHAPQQGLSDDEMVQSFSIATDFLEDLEKVWPHAEKEKCLEYLQDPKTIAVTNVVESESTELLKMKSNVLQREPTSWLPERLPNFTARKTEINDVIALLTKENMAIVSLHGGPGFGKTAIAIEVSHKLSEDYNIPVVFSQLNTTTSVDEMIRQLCLHVGVNYEDEDEDRKTSLILWLKNINSKVILVMDDIDHQLDDTCRSAFYEFVHLLRKNSNQHCQIVTTSRSSYETRELVTGEVNVEEMDVEACMELIKKQCPEQDDEFLRRLAELCGKIPLAMCIAGSRILDFKNSDELLKHLQQQPMKIRESNEYVYRAVDMSYRKCSDEEKETLHRLAVFEGSFNNNAAKVVTENLDTKCVLKNLVSKSLIKYEPTSRRYSMHLLIKHFLVEQQNGEDEIAKQAKVQAMLAELLMVKYYLKLGHELTMKSYSKDGYRESREALKLEANNIQNVLKLCCQQNDTATSDISDCLADSEIYTTSGRHFSLFIRTIIPDSIIDEFLQRCANMAEERKQHAIKISFDLLLADQERSRSTDKAELGKLYYAKMKEIQKKFETYYEDLKEDKSLCAHYYCQYGRYLSHKANEANEQEKCETLLKARKQQEESLRLRKTSTDTSVGIADVVYSLLQLGNACKMLSDSEHRKEAEKYYNEAKQLSQDNLGEHELTSLCYKYLGDLFNFLGGNIRGKINASGNTLFLQAATTPELD